MSAQLAYWLFAANQHTQQSKSHKWRVCAHCFQPTRAEATWTLCTCWSQHAESWWTFPLSLQYVSIQPLLNRYLEPEINYKVKLEQRRVVPFLVNWNVTVCVIFIIGLLSLWACYAAAEVLSVINKKMYISLQISLGCCYTAIFNPSEARHHTAAAETPLSCFKLCKSAENVHRPNLNYAKCSSQFIVNHSFASPFFHFHIPLP